MPLAGRLGGYESRNPMADELGEAKPAQNGIGEAARSSLASTEGGALETRERVSVLREEEQSPSASHSAGASESGS